MANIDALTVDDLYTKDQAEWPLTMGKIVYVDNIKEAKPGDIITDLEGFEVQLFKEMGLTPFHVDGDFHAAKVFSPSHSRYMLYIQGYLYKSVQDFMRHIMKQFIG